MNRTFFQKALSLLGLLSFVLTIGYTISAAKRNIFLIVICTISIIFIIEHLIKYEQNKQEIIRLNRKNLEYEKQNEKLRKRLELLYEEDLESEFESIPQYFDD